MARFIFNMLLLFLLVPATQTFAQRATPSYAHYRQDANINLQGLEDQILYYINQHRKAIGKPALQMIDVASKQATIHSVDMAKQKTPFGHEGFESRINTITKQTGNVNAAAENVATGKLTAQQVVDGWLHSPGHKKNIEGNYNFTGIGVAKDNNGQVFYTQIFILK